MTNLPYTKVAGKMKDLLERVGSFGRPEKVTHQWLASVGYKSSNDRSMIPVFKHIGLIDQAGTPTGLWSAFRRQNAQDKAQIADAVRKAYADLFNVYPDADRKDAEALRDYVRANTNLGVGAQTMCVQTFQALTKFGDFSAAPTGIAKETAATPGSKTGISRQVSSSTPGDLSLNITLQLELPATAEADVYDKLFASMRKHLLSLGEEAADAGKDT